MFYHRLLRAFPCVGFCVVLAATAPAHSAGDLRGLQSGSAAQNATEDNGTLTQNGTPAPIPTPAPMPALDIDGITLLDSGGWARPPVTSGAACCQPLSYAIPTKSVRVVAGLRYEMSVISSAAALGTDPSLVRVRLIHNVTESDADCYGDLDVENFAGAFSALNGAAIPVTASAAENSWQEARIPYSGLYGACYTADITQPVPLWRALPNISFLAFGAPKAAIDFWCAAEANRTCTIRVALPEATSRLTLLTTAGRCGFEPGEPEEQPFVQEMSLPSILSSSYADQTFGTYALTPAQTGTFRICLCHHYEFDVDADGIGVCRSSGAQDFPQSLGFLYLGMVSTVPDAVYPTLHFNLHVHCGDPVQGGCRADESLRIRFIDPGIDGNWGEPIEDDTCRTAAQSSSYATPPNCDQNNPFKCNLMPSFVSRSQPRWDDLTVRELMFNSLARTQRLGLCFCNGAANCAQPDSWLRLGVVIVNPILVFPDPIVVGVKTNLQLYGPGGDWWMTSVVAGSHALKLLYDPNQTHIASECAVASQTTGTLLNHQCASELQCSKPSTTSADGPTWHGIVIQRAGYYAVCYCDRHCSEQERWSLLKWHVAAGPEIMYAGVPTQGSTIYAGSRFELTVLGFGLSGSDELAFFYEGSLCGSPNNIPATGLLFESSSAPDLIGAEMPGQVGDFQSTSNGVRMALIVSHGLAVGDMIRFSNVTLKSAGGPCQSVYSTPLDRHISHCLEALTGLSLRILEVPSETEAILDLEMSAAECGALDFSFAHWYVTSRETFTGLQASRGSQGRYVVCWGKNPLTPLDYSAHAGVLQVLKPDTFISALHLTSITPGIIAPTILAFELGNSPTYKNAAGPMSLIFGFRNASRLRHSFRAGELAVPQRVAREAANQGVCGRLFREIWADSEEGFPQPKGCFYNEDVDEYGMLFSPQAGLRPGTKYQVVMFTQVSGILVSEHEWIVLLAQVPMPPFSPAEVRNTDPDTFGDVGEVPNELSCKEACARTLRCNVAVYRVNSDRHCVLADFSKRASPYATSRSLPDATLAMTMFLVDRLNKSNPKLTYTGQDQGTPDVVVDLWSMDDMLVHPFGVVESSEASASGTVGLAPTAIDPRWHQYDGLKVVADDEGGGVDTWTALELLPDAPKLRLRLRAAPGAPIEAGSAVRLFFWPLTQWALPPDCLVQCTPHDPLLQCSRPGCSAEALVTSPWMASRNMLRLLLPDDMEPITDDVMHTLSIEGRYLALPKGGFLPTKLAAEVSPKHSIGAFQPSVDYAQSTGRLPYVAVMVAGSVLSRDGNSHPFASDIDNVLYSRLRLGSTLRAGSSSDAKMVLHLPPGYNCKAASVAPEDLQTLSIWGAFPQGRGELDGQWSFSDNTCIYQLTPHAAVYGGSSIVIQLTVDNPSDPMAAEDIANTWAVSLTGLGDASSPLALEPYVLAGGLDSSLFPRNVAVIGRLLGASLVPTDFWWGAANNVIRVFFRTKQSSSDEFGVIKLEAPLGFGFYEYCEVEDLPLMHYAPIQGLYSGESFPIQRLGEKRICHASSSTLNPEPGYRPNMATINMDTPLTRATGYGFAIRIIHPRIYEPSQRTGFVLTTCAGDASKPLDQSPSVPLLQATASDEAPSYGIYADHARDLAFQVQISNTLPYAFTQISAEVRMRFGVPMAMDSTHELVQMYSKLIDWRVFAPYGYAWQFGNRIFFSRQQDITGVTADLPIKRPPLSPVLPPRNRLDFLSENEAIQGWKADQVYGFDTFINVPPEDPRDSVNEWIIEFGYDRETLPERMAAMITEAAPVRALHSFNVISLLSKLQGQNNELMFQFGTITTIPQQSGAIVFEAPTGFGFEAACTPLAPEIPYAPYIAIPARVDCQARVVAADEGALRPTVTVRPIDADIPRGFWSFILACVNPSSISNSAGNANAFLLTTYVDEVQGVVADVSALAQGFTVMQTMPHAEIVNNVDYGLSGRDDHPGQASNLVFAFDLRFRPALDGNHVLEVMAPKGFEFRTRCEVVIGADVFGLLQPYPKPYVAFTPGVRIISCTGYYHHARIMVSPGLVEGQRYAFRLRVDQQPQVSPIPNEWRLSFGSEASTALEGFPLWAFEGMALQISDTSRWNEANPVETHIDITFIAANTITVKGMIFLIAPAEYKIRFDCVIEVFQLAEDGVTPSAQVPNTVCRGAQPPVNNAQLRFQSEFAAIVSGVTYRLSILVTNPSVLPVLVGYWTLQSYAEASDETDWPGLVDIGRIPSEPITEYFTTFVVRRTSVESLKALTVQLEFDLELPHFISANDVITITGPEGYNFASPVADTLLEDDFRTCITFIDRPGSVSLAELPTPLCAGSAIRFRFRIAHEAFSRFRFLAISLWPRVMLSSRGSNFAALHRDETSLLATAVAYLTPITPRLIDFELAQIGARAAAVSSLGWMQLGFRPSQPAQAMSITTRIALLDFTLGVSFANVSSEVNVGGQVLKEVLVVHHGANSLAFAMQLLSNLRYTFILRGVMNPAMVGTVLWSVRTYKKPKPPGLLASMAMVSNPSAQITSTEVERPPHLYTSEEVRLWLDDANIRDEMIDWAAPPTVGRLQIATESGFLQSSFFDFPDTRVSFTMSVTPNAAPPGHRLLVFAPADWQFIESSFVGGDKFPAFDDLGPKSCMDTMKNELRLIYFIRILESIRASGPCRFNPTQICKSVVAFSFAASTPPTPKDMPRWRRESNQAWLLQVDAHDGDNCGPMGSSLDNELVRFTNDELFPGFQLKESLGGMIVVPEPHGQMSRQKTSIAVEFETRTVLTLAAPAGPPEDMQSLALFLRLDTVSGLDFERGCLAAVPDPDYSFCTGQGKLAVVRIRESTFATGRHKIVLRATNPSQTPNPNLWMLESFVGVTFEEARQGRFRNVRQRGRAPGYIIWQYLAATLTPATTQRSSTTQIFLWLRPSTFVEPLGYVEVHAPQDFEVSCNPQVLLIYFPPGRCRTFTATSGSELNDLHHVLQILLSEGTFLLPNNEYELSFNTRSPAFVGPSFALNWGVRLSNAARETLEANMEVGYYNLTNFQFSVVSLVPSATERYAKNEVRLMISFGRELPLTDISELRILAPLGWDIRALCARYEDITGGPAAYHMQLPYAEERGHHSCPQANVLLLLLDQARVIKEGIYTLLVGARNPATTTRRNFWTVGLLSPGQNLGWTPAMKDSKVSPGGLKPGQLVVSETIVMGFEVGDRLGLTPPPSPLKGNYFEVLSGSVPHHFAQHIVIAVLMVCL